MKETEQTLLDQIKDEVAISHGYLHWNEIEDDHLEDVENKLWPIVCERYAEAKAKASCEATLKAKEEKKHEWTTDEIMSMVENNPAKQTESAYKEFEGNCSKCGHPLNPATAGYQCTNINCPAVESSEPQEKEPTAYQKRKAIEKRAVWLKYCLDIGWTKDQLDGLEKIWDQYHDEFGNLIKAVSAPSESQEDMWDEIYNNAITWHSQEFNKEYLKRFTITRNP